MEKKKKKIQPHQQRRAEPGGVEVGSLFARYFRTSFTKIYSLLMTITLEAIAEPNNLIEAAKSVIRNRGAAGIDGMGVRELKAHMQEHIGTLRAMLLERTYTPKPVKRVWIPKENGKMRGLGIPTVIDRVVQQAIANILTKEVEPTFSERSYGFRPGRGAHMAVNKALELANEGYTWVVETDLAKFFDTVPHQRLIGKLSYRIEDGRVLSLIHRIMRAGVDNEGKLEPTEMGVPQGGPLSPLLANIYLDELDKVLEARGHQIVRYADDMMVLCKSKRSAERTLQGIIKYAEGKMKLTVNREKSGVYWIGNSRVKFLTHGFYWNSSKKSFQLTVHKKGRIKMKQKLKEILKRNREHSLEDVKRELSTYLRGVVNYFKLAIRGGEKWVTDMDSWIRRRIRQLIWKAWKNPSTRRRNLQKLGVTKWQYVAYTRKGYWAIAKSQVLHHAISNERLEKREWMWIRSLLDTKQMVLF